MRNDPVLGFHVSSGTALVRMELAVFLIFQSTHPVRGGTISMEDSSHRNKISIHPPREGWDGVKAGLVSMASVISIHPPREGWDQEMGFISMSSCISIHPPREGWDNA